MRALDLANIFLVIFISITMIAHVKAEDNNLDQANQSQFTEFFDSAVEDSAKYLARLEAQQTQDGVRYSKEKQLSVSTDLVSSFYNNLALKFGVEGDDVEIENIMLHIPAMAILRYNGIQLVTVTDSLDQGTNGQIKPYIWPLKPFTRVLNNGCIIYFTMDDNVTLYDPTSNQYFQGTFQDMQYVRNLAPIVTYDDFQKYRNKTITDTLEEELSGAINRHLQLTKKIGLQVKFSLPEGIEDQPINNIGFFAFIQGYPLPGGELLSTYSFASGAVSQREEYIGTIREDGRHVAYTKSCQIPSTSLIIENLYNDEEAARKGYFTVDCDN